MSNAKTNLSDLVPGPAQSLHYLKQVSRIKHQILSGYFGAWSGILGSAYPHLDYWDCYAGDGCYVDENGAQLPGSPQRALQVATDFVSRSEGRSVTLSFIEKDQDKAARLAEILHVMSTPLSVSVQVVSGDAYGLVDKVVTPTTRAGLTVPTLFFVDPCGYPLPIPILRRLLSRPKSEVLLNLMWYRLNMDLGNPLKRDTIGRMFGEEKWLDEDFDALHGREKEEAFLRYFVKSVGARYSRIFQMTYSPEDRVPGFDKRRKYHLIHFSNHPSGAVAMREVMHRAGERLKKLHPQSSQTSFDFIESDRIEISDLKEVLRDRFTSGRRVTFHQILLETVDLDFVESHFREALKEMEQQGAVRIERLQSKKTGVAPRDVILLLPVQKITRKPT